MADLKKVVVKRPQVLINVPLQKTGSIDLSPDSQIGQAALQVEKEFAGDGRVLLRASGTEPVIRVMVEGNDAGRVAANRAIFSGNGDGYIHPEE